MLTDEERLRVYGGPDGVAAVDAYIKDLVASFPPLTPKQRARLTVLFRHSAPVAPSRTPPRSTEPQRAAA